MTAEEIQQVQLYIADLNAKHEKQVAELRRQLDYEQKFRKIAQADALKMGTAVHTMWDLSRQQPPVPTEIFSQNIRQIINHYCPDFDIPF